MRLYFALSCLVSFNFHTVEAYAPSRALVSRFVHTKPITSLQQPFATTNSIRRNLSLHKMVPVNNRKRNIGLFPVPRTVKRSFVDVSTRESSSPVEGGNSQKNFLGKLYDATLGKIVALFLHLMKILVKNPYIKLRNAFRKDPVKEEDTQQAVNGENVEESINGEHERKINLKIDLNSSKVVNQESMCGGEKKVYCRCWKSGTFPLCDGAHVEHNKISGDNIGPLIISVDKDKEKQMEKKVTTAEKVIENISAVTSKATEQSSKIPFFATEVAKFFSPEVKEEPKKSISEKIEVSSEKQQTPTGQRWAVSSPDVDLTGKWKMVATDQFKIDYNAYLKNLGQPSLVRSVAVSIVELTTEEIAQADEGRKVTIKGINLRGVWDRTLIASGSDYSSHHDPDEDEHLRVPLVTADKEEVQSEAWWENNGTVHVSWLRGVKKYGGGDFESRRFLENGNLICESVFHPNAVDKEKAAIRWVFERIS